MGTGATVYIVYCDGACEPNPGYGGAGYLALAPDGSKQTDFLAFEGITTNQQMEILAAAHGVLLTPPGSTVLVYSDSQYVVNTMMKGWRQRANKPFWRTLADACSSRTVTFHWVKGHNGNPFNEEADALSLQGCRQAQAQYTFDLNSTLDAQLDFHLEQEP